MHADVRALRVVEVVLLLLPAEGALRQEVADEVFSAARQLQQQHRDVAEMYGPSSSGGVRSAVSGGTSLGAVLPRTAWYSKGWSQA